MSQGSIQNVAASVHARLLNKARTSRKPFNELLQYYAMERFLYRLSKSRHAERFILKGALMLRAYGAVPMRPTRDIDLLGRDPSAAGQLESVIRDCLAVGVEEDGMRFDPETISSEEIATVAEYQGVRLLFKGYLGTARVSMQIDIAFGDVLVPGPLWIEYPELLNSGMLRLLAYSLESAIAEKFQAMVALDIANSRMKDFYDIWFIARENTFNGDQLGEAIRQTFERRSTMLPTEVPTALTPHFYGDPMKQRQWSAFIQRSLLQNAATLQSVAEKIEKFLMPPCLAIASGESFNAQWKLGGPWTGNEAGE